MKHLYIYIFVAYIVVEDCGAASGDGVRHMPGI